MFCTAVITAIRYCTAKSDNLIENKSNTLSLNKWFHVQSHFDDYNLLFSGIQNIKSPNIITTKRTERKTPGRPFSSDKKPQQKQLLCPFHSLLMRLLIWHCNNLPFTAFTSSSRHPHLPFIHLQLSLPSRPRNQSGVEPRMSTSTLTHTVTHGPAYIQVALCLA